MISSEEIKIENVKEFVDNAERLFGRMVNIEGKDGYTKVNCMVNEVRKYLKENVARLEADDF